MYGWSGTGPCGSLLRTNPFCVPCFLLVGNRLHAASLIFPEFQRADSKSWLSRRGGVAETKKQLGKNSAAMGAGSWFLLKEYIFKKKKIPLSSSAGTKSPTQKEDGNFRLSSGSLEHDPVTSPPASKKKACKHQKVTKTLTPSTNESPFKNRDGCQRQKYRSIEQNRKPRDKSTNLWTPYLWQRRQGYTMEKRQPL